MSGAPRIEPMAPRPVRRPPSAASDSRPPAAAAPAATAPAPAPAPTNGALATKADASLALPEGWSREDVDLLKDTIAKGCTDAELRLFMLVCRQTGLSPFARQIYMIRRWDDTLGREVASPQTSIDGFRLAAARTGQHDGSQTQWCGLDGVWHDAWLWDEPPAAAMTTVWRKGSTRGFTAVALFREYVQKKRSGGVTKMWLSMPAGQLGKCSESLALRKAFPAELSGLYTREEMEQATVVRDETPTAAQPVAEVRPAIAPAQHPRDILQAKVSARLQQLGVTNDGRRAVIQLAGGPEAKFLGELKDEALQALATGLIPQAKVDKWNAMGAALREAENQPEPKPPVTEPEVLPPLDGDNTATARLVRSIPKAHPEQSAVAVAPEEGEEDPDDSDDPASWALAGDEPGDDETKS
jgi:phage recombination protein Bet